MAELRGIGMKNARHLEDQNMLTGDLTLEGKNIGTWGKDEKTNANYIDLILPNANFNISKLANVLSTRQNLSDNPQDTICFVDLLFAMSMAESEYTKEEVPEGSKAELVLIPQTNSFTVVITLKDLSLEDLKKDTAEALGSEITQNDMFIIEFKNKRDFINHEGFTFSDFLM